MSIVVKNIRWIMIVAGVLTATMFHAAIAPESALQVNFGETLTGPVAQIVVRSWGALIGLVGLMLIYGAFHPPQRPLVLTVAAVSKAFFIVLMFWHGHGYLHTRAGVWAHVDLVMVALFVWYLGETRRAPTTG